MTRPYFGNLFWMGVWPPSNLTWGPPPDRDQCPFIPLPLVLLCWFSCTLCRSLGLYPAAWEYMLPLDYHVDNWWRRVKAGGFASEHEMGVAFDGRRTVYFSEGWSSSWLGQWFWSFRYSLIILSSIIFKIKWSKNRNGRVNVPLVTLKSSRNTHCFKA